MCCELSKKEIELLEMFFKVSEDEDQVICFYRVVQNSNIVLKLVELYKQFKRASDGQKTLSRRKFSDIMNQCFPRTHKVNN